MSDLLQAIADVQCADAFEGFDSFDTTTLRRYHEVCVALGESNFLNHGVRFTFHVSSKERYRKLEHAGPAELRSVMMDLRQLWMKKERTHFPKVRNMLHRHADGKGSAASVEAVTQLDGIGRRYSEALKTTLMSFVDPVNPMVALKTISAEQVVQDWLYSGPAHWDEERAARVKLWSKEGYEFSLTKALNSFADVYWELDLLVQGILGEPSLVMSSA
ncbi:MAG: hypothetical protein ACLP1Q_00910 [Solirubrobacteraceae bacterium]|jgi:hypothetical protein